VLAVSFRTLPTDATPDDLAHAIGPIRPAGAPDAHDQRLPAAVLGELAALSALLERLTPVPDEVARALRLSPIAQAEFHPFFHEIAEVEPADDPDEPITLLAERWPGYLLGSLLLQRSGVLVRAGAAHVDAAVATTSRLHWATRRPHRPTATTPPRPPHRRRALLQRGRPTPRGRGPATCATAKARATAWSGNASARTA
jgi:hypothetical protein